MEFIKHSSLGKAWSPIIVKWTLKVLGDLSAKAGRSKSQLNEDLSSWMATISGNRLCDLTAECMTRLNEKQTEDCISQLLADVSFKLKLKPFQNWAKKNGECFERHKCQFVHILQYKKVFFPFPSSSNDCVTIGDFERHISTLRGMRGCH